MQNKKLLYILGGFALTAVVAGAMYFSSGTLFKGDFGDAEDITSKKGAYDTAQKATIAAKAAETKAGTAVSEANTAYFIAQEATKTAASKDSLVAELIMAKVKAKTAYDTAVKDYEKAGEAVKTAETAEATAKKAVEDLSATPPPAAETIETLTASKGSI